MRVKFLICIHTYGVTQVQRVIWKRFFCHADKPILTSKLGSDTMYLQSKLGKGGYEMNREEILLKSKRENQNEDELQRQNHKKADAYGFFVNSFVYVVLCLLAEFGFVKGTITIFSCSLPVQDAMRLACLLGLSFSYWCTYYYIRKKRYLFVAIFFTVGLCCGIVRFFW